MFWNWRSVRIAVGVALLILGLIVLLPNITGYTSLDGTVNARLIIMAAPIEGTVVNTAPKSGTALIKGERLLSIKNDRVNRFLLTELEADLRATQDTLKAIALHEAELNALRDDLQDRLNLYKSAMLHNVDQEINAQQERIGANEARADERLGDLIRKQALRVSGHLSQTELERTQAAEEVAKHELDASKIELDRLKHKREAVQKGVYIEEGRNDAPYSLQRIDEVTITVVNLASRRDEQRARLIKLQQQIAAESERVNLLGSTWLQSETDGVVWRISVVAGSNVTVG